MLQTSVPNVLSIFRRMLQVFIWVLHMFHTYVASVLSGCCVCFTMVFKCFQVFLQVFQMHVSSASSVFRRMLQVLHLNISKVDRVLHLPSRLLLPRLGVLSSSQYRLGIRHLLPLFSKLVIFAVARAPHRRAKRHEKMTASAGVQTPRPSGRPSASKAYTQGEPSNTSFFPYLYKQ